VLRRPKSLPQLLAIAHVMQGLACVPLLWWFWPGDMPPLVVYWKPLLAESLCYFLGQAGLFIALRHTDASRVSPLLGVKVVILAILSTAALHQYLTPLQWVAAVLAVLAAFVLNRSGGSVPWRAGLGLVMAWTGYSLSDFFIRVYVNRMAPMDPLKAGLLGMYMSYLICGVAGLVLLPWYGSRQWRDWRDAAPYAFLWFTAMLCFYTTLAAVGLVLAAMLQSTRSFWSLIIGAIISHFGYHALEQRVPRGVLLRRAIGAAMMVAAVALYVSQSHRQAVEAPPASPFGRHMIASVAKPVELAMSKAARGT
jgi:drug/metabolite transporter (DMT)-like permease